VGEVHEIIRRESEPETYHVEQRMKREKKRKKTIRKWNTNQKNENAKKYVDGVGH